MGNTRSIFGKFSQNQNYNKQQWSILHIKDGMQILRHNQKGTIINVYKLPMASTFKDLQMLQFRHLHGFYLVKVLDVIKPQKPLKQCKSQNVFLIFQHLIAQFSQIKTLSVQQFLYTISCIFKGYSLLSSSYGLFELKQNMIWINQQGKVKIWFNSNLCQNVSEHPYVSQFCKSKSQHKKKYTNNIINKILAIFENKTSQQYVSTFKKKISHLNNFTQVSTAIEQFSQKMNFKLPSCIAMNKNQLVNLSTRQYTKNIDKNDNIVHKNLPAKANSPKVDKKYSLNTIQQQKKHQKYSQQYRTGIQRTSICFPFNIQIQLDKNPRQSLYYPKPNNNLPTKKYGFQQKIKHLKFKPVSCKQQYKNIKEKNNVLPYYQQKVQDNSHIQENLRSTDYTHAKKYTDFTDCSQIKKYEPSQTSYYLNKEHNHNLNEYSKSQHIKQIDYTKTAKSYKDNLSTQGLPKNSSSLQQRYETKISTPKRQNQQKYFPKYTDKKNAENFQQQKKQLRKTENIKRFQYQYNINIKDQNKKLIQQFRDEKYGKNYKNDKKGMKNDYQYQFSNQSKLKSQKSKQKQRIYDNNFLNIPKKPIKTMSMNSNQTIMQQLKLIDADYEEQPETPMRILQDKQFNPIESVVDEMTNPQELQNKLNKIKINDLLLERTKRQYQQENRRLTSPTQFYQKICSKDPVKVNSKQFESYYQPNFDKNKKNTYLTMLERQKQQQKQQNHTFHKNKHYNKKLLTEETDRIDAKYAKYIARSNPKNDKGYIQRQLSHKNSLSHEFLAKHTIKVRQKQR